MTAAGWGFVPEGWTPPKQKPHRCARGWGVTPSTWSPPKRARLVEGVMDDPSRPRSMDEVLQLTLAYLEGHGPTLMSVICDEVHANAARVRVALFQLESIGDVIRVGAKWKAAP